MNSWMTIRRLPVTTVFSAFTTTTVSPFKSRFAMRLAARPRTRPEASTTVALLGTSTSGSVAGAAVGGFGDPVPVGFFALAAFGADFGAFGTAGFSPSDFASTDFGLARAPFGFSVGGAAGSDAAAGAGAEVSGNDVDP